MKSVAIIYGWAEGSWQGKKFVKELHRNGFTIAENAKNADIIFAHSAGCYLVPKDTKAKLVVLAGLPYWPGRNLVSGLIRKLINEVRYHRRNKGLGWWLNKIAHSGWYIISRPQKTYYLVTRHKIANLHDRINAKVLLVRASDDTFLHPNAVSMLPRGKKYRYVEIPGAHDDCWFEPKPYIDLLLKEL